MINNQLDRLNLNFFWGKKLKPLKPLKIIHWGPFKVKVVPCRIENYTLNFWLVKPKLCLFAGCTRSRNYHNFTVLSIEVARWWRANGGRRTGLTDSLCPPVGDADDPLLQRAFKNRADIFPLPPSKTHARKSPFIDTSAPNHKPARLPNQTPPQPGGRMATASYQDAPNNCGQSEIWTGRCSSVRSAAISNMTVLRLSWGQFRQQPNPTQSRGLMLNRLR